ncbi:carotenoid 1,2-hydratase [Vibrio sp. sp1]|uniref:lipocalin-like domain-containing protein n=1 Tax=Vibrio TaxID=662 RepID=UPI001962E986|nr:MULTISPECIES: lipocalin-like domain-containing protein [Vibrio]ELA6599556.1 carotenoid 1,2-hydratase [Vibrio alginolyticus]EMD1210730.1 carotenoid 1,2-hydratase [Vibrio alginolyticus]MCA2482261.1 carotenoid 1,2-hydratase [Vibrio alginolyticus]MDA0420981.1 carotenoid 1,2-hydratase [Vibrio alginolyticus]MDW2010064.1 lipocalin-like domain-containing protein [Vibrio sp. Vb0301]
MKKMGSKKRLLVSTLIVVTFAFLTGAAFYSTFWLEATATRESELDSILTRENQTIFEPVLPNEHVSLPSDFRFHPEYQHEWWHYFAKLKDEQGKIYNVQWSYFRVATDERETSGWQNPQLYISHVVVSHGSHVWKEQRVARGGIGQAGMINRPFRLWIDNWTWRSLGATPFPGNLNVNTDTFGLELNTMTSGPFVVNGDKGFQVKHALQSVASFSFSAPFLKVKGSLSLNGKRFLVTGSAWAQKEWGSGLIGEGQQGWDWFVFNLDDGRALTVSRYRHHGQTPHVFGTLSTRSGKVINLSDDDISIKPMQVTSLSNGRRLPLQWIINIPKHQINLTTRIIKSDMWLPFVIPYWEGPTLASGSNEAWGFMQLTGY